MQATIAALRRGGMGKTFLGEVHQLVPDLEEGVRTPYLRYSSALKSQREGPVRMYPVLN